MKRGTWFALNPLNWFRSWRFHRKQSGFDKSTYDLELYLYSNMLKNDMLHYGYFKNADIDPEIISIRSLEDAQMLYAEKIAEQISNKKEKVLDIGCGMGGLAALLIRENYLVETLTPNANQFQHIQKKYPGLVCYHTKLENFQTANQYGTIINAESLQYIQLEDAFKKADQLLLPNGRWVITDYFRTTENSANRSGHLLTRFSEQAAANNWNIILQEDITQHVLPTLKLVNVYVNRFLLPLKHFGSEKLRYKKAWLYYLTQELRASAEKKITKELASVDPQIFAAEKKYILFVLEKNNS